MNISLKYNFEEGLHKKSYFQKCDTEKIFDSPNLKK